MRFGVDLGGTKIEVVALAGAGAPPVRRRAATPASGYDAILDTIADLLGQVERSVEVRADRVGIATPGSLSPASGLIRNSNSTALNGRPLDRDLGRRLGRPVRLANDADCFALAEAVSGAGRGAGSVFGVILGTGVGGGIVVRDALLRGRNGIAGEWGHNPLPDPQDDERPGPACYCGRRGCVEAWCSGPGLAADHARRTGEALDAEAIAKRAAAGDREAEATLRRHLDRLGRSLAGVVNVLDPEAIVLGGGLSNLRHLADRLPDAMRPHIFSDVFETAVVRNELGDSAGVIGAAWLWPEGPEER